MKNKFEGGKQWSADEAEMEILAVRQEVALMGANDSEFARIGEILGGLRSGEIEPNEAVRQAHKIKDEKSDYH